MSRIFLLLLSMCIAPGNALAEGTLRDRIHDRVQERMAGQKAEGVQSGVKPAPRATIAGLEVAYWLPAHMPAPLILFSHGFGGCSTQSKFLTKALADAGYVVVAPNHKDASCRQGERQKPTLPFREPEAWTQETYYDRGEDIRHLLDGLKQDKTWNARIDWAKIGLAGHSLGGYTMLGVAGGWPKWKMGGISAVLAVSPFATPYIEKKMLKDIHVPVMYQGGTRDFGVTPHLREKGGAYDQTPTAWYVEFEGAGHYAWTDLQTDHQRLIDAYSIAFFNHTLKGAPFTLGKQAGVSIFKTKD